MTGVTRSTSASKVLPVRAGRRRDSSRKRRAGTLFYLGIATTIGVLWSEPKWAIYLLSAVLIGGFAAWLGLSELSSGQRPLADVEFRLFGPAVIFMVVGLGIVLFRGPNLRAKQRQLDAEIDEIVTRNKS